MQTMRFNFIWLYKHKNLIVPRKKTEPDHNHFRMIRLTYSSISIQWFIRKRFFLLQKNRLICLEHRLDWLNQCQTTDVPIWTITMPHNEIIQISNQINGFMCGRWTFPHRSHTTDFILLTFSDVFSFRFRFLVVLSTYLLMCGGTLKRVD